jgi:TatD DNase family protein
VTGSLPPGDPPLFDAHLHLHDQRLRQAVGSNWRFPGVTAQVCNGTCPEDWEAVADLPEPDGTRLLRAFGVHPWKVDRLPENWEARLRGYLEGGAVSVGEIGLDHWIEPRDERLQIEVFERQLALAAELALPPTIHCLRCWGLLLDRLRAAPDLSRGFLLHGFGGSREVLFELADLGGFFSFSAYAADPRRKRMRDAARACPLDRILVETDAPDMVPRPEDQHYSLLDSSRNPLHHPLEITTAYRFLENLRSLKTHDFRTRVARNFKRLFG